MSLTLPIRTRLTFLYSGLLVVSLALCGASVFGLFRYRLTERLHETLARRIQGVENFLVRETTEQTAGMIPMELEEYASTQFEGHLIEVKDETGRVLLRSEPVPLPSVVQEDLFKLYGREYRVLAAASLAPVETSLRELRWLLTALTPLLLLVTGAIGYLISSRALRPVDEMTQAARSVGPADLSMRLPVPISQDELSRLAEAWNEMLSRVEGSVTRIQRFTADAAHELRTPLTALRTTAELALRRERNSSEYREALEQVVVITERMSNLFDALLTLTRGDSDVREKRIGSVDMAEIVQGVCQEMRPLFVSKDVALTVRLPELLPPVRGDGPGLRRLLTALVENAWKYTDAGGTVLVSVRHEDSEQILEVADSGCGIPIESLPHIFDRFYRVDSSRDRRSGGYGLGLSIAQQIARFHSADIEVGSAAEKGSCFRLRLPYEPGRSNPPVNQ